MEGGEKEKKTNTTGFMRGSVARGISRGSVVWKEVGDVPKGGTLVFILNSNEFLLAPSLSNQTKPVLS